MRESFRNYFLHSRVRRHLEERRCAAAEQEAAKRQKERDARTREADLRALFLRLDSEGKKVFQAWLENSGEFTPAQMERILAAPPPAQEEP